MKLADCAGPEFAQQPHGNQSCPNFPGGITAGAPRASPVRVEDLLRRMRAGDREAAAQFIVTYASRVRRRIRGKLGSQMRRLFDSQEILSTIGRRLDLYVRDRRLKATEEGQLWAFIFTMANNALIQKARIFQRLQAVEGSDGRFAQELLGRLEEVERQSSSSVELEIDKALASLDDAMDREILSMWLQGRNHGQIAEEIGAGHACVRKRWQRIRERLRGFIDSGVL